MNVREVIIEAVIKSNIEKVWACYTEPRHIVCWNFASNDWHCPEAENELRAGGCYTARMEARDGSFGFDFRAVYDRVEPFKELAYTLEDGRKVVVRFEDAGSGIRVTTLFEAENASPLDMQKAGWQAILNNFKSYVELGV